MAIYSEPHLLSLNQEGEETCQETGTTEEETDMAIGTETEDGQTLGIVIGEKISLPVTFTVIEK